MTSSQKFHMEPPANWQTTIDNIRKVRAKYPAPVDSMGCDHTSDRQDLGMNQRYQVLTSLMLSSQTKDPITWAASQKLKEAGLGNVQGMLGANEKDIEELIHPVGFYRRKAVYLKKVAEILAKDYNCDIPDNIEDLCKLPGVGPKMAHLCMSEAWNVVTGIGVDTHVHRISGRLGWVPPKDIKTPEDTRRALESWLPRELWREINHMLVGFGQTICTPLRPKCGECYNNTICPSSDLKSKKIEGKRKAKPKVEVKEEAEAVEDQCGPKVKIKDEPEEIIDTNQTTSGATKKPTKAATLNKKTKKKIDEPALGESKADKKIKMEPEIKEAEPEMKLESTEQIETTWTPARATEVLDAANLIVGTTITISTTRAITRAMKREATANNKQTT